MYKEYTKDLPSINMQRGINAREMLLDHLKQNLDKEFTLEQLKSILTPDLQTMDTARLLRILGDNLVLKRSEYRLKTTKIKNPNNLKLGGAKTINTYTLIRK